jgi:precorrin-6x reductase
VRLLRTDEGAENEGRQMQGYDAVYVDSATSAAAYLVDTEGRILLTTGSKELGAFREIPADRLYVRVLPTAAGIAACEQAGIPYRNIIAMVGPFSQEMNAATMRQYQIAWMVTKDSGKAGGFDEKMEACRETGARPVVIERPRECGLSMEEVLALIG